MTQHVEKSAMMASIQEAYCSYEVSKLLKEKGFDWECTSHFDEEGKVFPNAPINFNVTKYWISRPTLQMAIKWLREVHKVFIEVCVSIDINGDYHYSYFILDKKCKYIRKGFTDFDWNYEEAVEAALKYSLENLL